MVRSFFNNELSAVICMSEVIKEYANDQVTVVWQPSKCSHSAVCAKGLAEVFNPKQRPWINMQGSDSDSIVKTVKQCPSGALSIKGDELKPQAGADDVVIKVLANGPMLVKCKVSFTMPDGTTKEVANPALCRCGASANKPFCDGAHVKAGFKG
ncbi:MAG: putative Fe-S cluster protein YjdI [Cryomorphaceae bacterium]